MKQRTVQYNKSDETIEYSQSLYLRLPIELLEIVSSIVAFFHLLMVERKWVKVSKTISDSPEGVNETLRKIWFARMLRRLLSVIMRTPLRSKVIKLVDNRLILPKSGCVIVIPHTPWARLLAEWCRSKKFAIVFVGGPWIKRTADVNVPGAGISGIRKVIHHLNSNEHVVVIGDNENRPPFCNVSYLGRICNASLLPVRLASLARVPIVTVIPKFEGRCIMLQNGLIIEPDNIIQNEHQVLQKIFSYFETEIYESPSIYSPYILVV